MNNSILNKNQDRLYRLSLWAVFILTTLFFTWISVAEISQVVRVDGKIIPTGRSQQIQHLEGGIIASIDTQEGTLVQKGDLLLTIDRTIAGASLSETKIKLEAEMARAARLKAAAAGADEVKFEGDIKNSKSAEAEKALFNARVNMLKGDLDVYQSLYNQKIAELQDARARKIRLSAELQTAEERKRIVDQMQQSGVATKLEVLDARGREQTLRTEIGNVTGLIPKLEEEIAEARARIDSAKTSFKADAQKDYVESVAEINRLNQIITAANDRLERTEIRAPVTGIINSIAVNTVGGVVKAGEPLLEITPSSTGILIEAKAQPKDRGYIRPGLKTEIRISTYDPAEYGLIPGEVTKVGSDSLRDQNGNTFYLVSIKVNSLPDHYIGKEMIPGMTVTSDIVTGKRTILSYLLSPLRKFTYNMFRDPR